MTTLATYEGVVRQGKIQLTQAAVLPEGSQVYVLVVNEREQAALLDPRLAGGKRVTGWYHVGSVTAQELQLQQVAGRLIWQFKAFLTAPGQPPRWPVGLVLNGEDTVTQTIANAAATARSLSSPEI